MKRILIALLVFCALNTKVHSQYADVGTGALKDKIWWFDWNGFTMANGASKTFNTPDGLTVTITFSGLQGLVCQPSVMNTWSGAVLHYLYNFSNSNIKPAFYSPFSNQNIAFTLNVTATRNGLPVPFKFVAADAEGTGFNETINLVTSGGNWSCIDFFRNSSQTTNPFAGCNTTSATLTETYGMAAGIGQNPVLATDAPNSGSLTVNCLFTWPTVSGLTGLAFGIFSPVDRGDLPASYGYVQHKLGFTGVNQCNYLPPLPSLVQSEALKLGSVAGDADGAESANDNTVGADEEAVNTFPIYTNSGSYSLPVNLANTTGSNAYLTGWFDFNRNGVFENNERVTNTIANNAISSVLNWTGLPAVLPGAALAPCAFRFRFSSNMISTQNATGFAPDGEVEDYYEIITEGTAVADFSIPDTVCVNTPVTIINASTNATTSFWNFCVANVNSTPGATNLGNIGGQFGLPVFIDYAQYNGNYYGFVTNNMPGKLTRLDFGNSLLNTPTAVNLGNVGGVIPDACEGIQLAFNEGRWYAIIVGGNSTVATNSRIVKIDFGPNLTNISPVGTNWGNIGGLNYPGDLHLFNDNGNWYAFTVDANSSVIRFSFGPSFQNPPTAVNFGNLGGVLNYTNGIYVINDNGQWHAFVSSRNSSSIARLNFGNSLLNTPTVTDLGNPNNTLDMPRDIYIMKFCNELIGFVVNEGTHDIVKLNFASVTSIPTAVSLGNIGSLSFPHSISKIFRVGADLYSFIPNVNNNTLTRINFTGCTNSSIPNYSGPTPPPVTYTTPGIYNINLTIDDGLPSQTSICKQIVVKNCAREISGVINDYTEVLAFDPCKNALTVADATAYKIGDTVLLIQMKGAEINVTNTVAFGTITNYRNSGNYEFNYVKSKTGNSIELKNVLTRQYDIPAGVVQLVRVPYYQKAIVSSTLTCLPWDGSKGGILAFNVRDTLVMNSDINVNGKGFNGGAGNNSGLLVTNCFTNNFSYPSPSTIAAGKGEGIALLNNTNNRGKGAAANAGGGGVDHNSGGGGGGNAGTGGFGGFQLEPCGSAPYNNRGIGGSLLLYNNATNKIFMGGGGGGGHANNPANINFPSNGGNGGAIVIVSAQALQGNSFKILANGNDAPGCPVGVTGDCHDGMGGGGAAGTVLLNIPNVISNTPVEIKGGKGADVSGPIATAGRIGAGGGGSAGIFWSATPALPANITVNVTGGQNGVLLQDGNNPWGATGGSLGITLFNLQLPIDLVPFKPNIDSVRIKDSITACKSFDFKGLGYTNTDPVASWQWYFGDGGTATAQNASHTYTNDGTYIVKLIITDINGCKDSITKEVSTISLHLDFNYQLDACNPLSVRFNALGNATQNPLWSFGDLATVTGTFNPVHVYPSENSYNVEYSAGDGICADTVTKTITLAIMPADIVLTPDTTICYGSVKQLRTSPALSFCWSPVTYLSDPNSANPVTSTPHNITYYYTAESTGNNLVVNGDFSQGNTGFTSEYTYTSPNTAEGQYFIGTNPSAWSGAYNNCGDHTSLNGNMMIVNSVQHTEGNVWKETIPVLPNTNYAFSTWLLCLMPNNAAQVQLSINDENIGASINAVTSSCSWVQFYTTWNSGNNTTAVISIVNKELAPSGNDFALDDISFAPVFIKRDSVKITVDSPYVKTNDDDVVCEGKPLQLNTTGAAAYTWSPATALSHAGIANPIATPVVSTQYIVTGTNTNGCTAKDTVNITVNPKPAITKSADKEICKNTSVQIFATGGVTYAWTPAATLDDPTLSNPTATPTADTRYYVTVTDANTCTNNDSVDISIRPDPIFTVGAGGPICENDSIQLTAAGGDIYAWQPALALNNPGIANPRAAPASSTDYFVTITETTCGNSTVLQTSVTVNPLPLVKATKLTDLDCSNDRSQLSATGAASYTWTPVFSLNNPAIANPIASPTATTEYFVKGTDALGCHNYDSVTVSFLAINASGYFMPNAFTPNHDGLNDCYGIRYWGIIRELEFSIYNRWGERIFFTKDPNACWDGSYKGRMQDIGVYVYMINAKTLCGDTFKKGLFTLAK